MFLLDLRHSLPHITGKEAERALVSVGITVNKNMVPFDSRSPFQTSGLRFGTPAVTTRGLVEKDMISIAYLIHLTLTHLGDDEMMNNIRQNVKALVKDKPLFVWPS